MTLAEFKTQHPEMFTSNGDVIAKYQSIVDKMVKEDNPLQLYESTSGYIVISRNPNLKEIDLNKRILFKSMYANVLTELNITESVTMIPADPQVIESKILNLNVKIHSMLTNNVELSKSILRHLECLVISKKELIGFLKTLEKSNKK